MLNITKFILTRLLSITLLFSLADDAIATGGEEKIPQQTYVAPLPQLNELTLALPKYSSGGQPSGGQAGAAGFAAQPPLRSNSISKKKRPIAMAPPQPNLSSGNNPWLPGNNSAAAGGVIVNNNAAGNPHQNPQIAGGTIQKDFGGFRPPLHSPQTPMMQQQQQRTLRQKSIRNSKASMPNGLFDPPKNMSQIPMDQTINTGTRRIVYKSDGEMIMENPQNGELWERTRGGHLYHQSARGRQYEVKQGGQLVPMDGGGNAAAAAGPSGTSQGRSLRGQSMRANQMIATYKYGNHLQNQQQGSANNFGEAAADVYANAGHNLVEWTKPVVQYGLPVVVSIAKKAHQIVTDPDNIERAKTAANYVSSNVLMPAANHVGNVLSSVKENLSNQDYYDENHEGNNNCAYGHCGANANPWPFNFDDGQYGGGGRHH